MSSILLKIYKGELPHSKPKHLWREKPEHWPSNKPFYDTKNHPHDEYKCFISDNELLKCLMQCCDCKKVYINNVYRKEIAARRENRNQLLYKLYTFRTETEKIKMVLQNFTIYRDNDELNEALDNINVKLCLKIGDSDLNNDPTKRLKNQSEMIADTTRYLSAVVCKIIKGKDPESKCDGIWTAPPEQWPTNVPFFSPFNRGKCKYTCSDQLLLSTLLQHPKAVIPPKYKSLVEAFQTVVNATDKKEAKKHKEVLCRVKTIQTDVAVLDYALKYLYSDGFFTTEVCHPLHQWWSSQNVENQIEITFANLHRISEERPTIFIAVTRECMKLSIMQSTIDYTNKSEVCYNISFDESIPTTLDSYSQNCSDVDQLCTDDNLQGACVIKNLQIPDEQKSCSNAASLNKSDHGKDTTQYSFINNDNETDFSTLNDTLFSRHKLLPVESNILQLIELEKSKENATSNTVSISNRKETFARDSRQTNCTTDVSGINPHHTGQCDNNQRAIVPETNESQVFIEKQSKGKKRKFANESTDNGMSKKMLMESDTIKDCLHKLTGEETVSDNHFDIDFLLENYIPNCFQHKSTTETSKTESSLGSAEDELMDISLPVSSDNDEVDDGLEIFLTDFINYESGKRSRLEKELLLDNS